MNKMKELNQKEINSITGTGTTTDVLYITGMAIGAPTGFYMPNDKLLAVPALIVSGAAIGRMTGEYLEKGATKVGETYQMLSSIVAAKLASLQHSQSKQQF